MVALRYAVLIGSFLVAAPLAAMPEGAVPGDSAGIDARVSSVALSPAAQAIEAALQQPEGVDHAIFDAVRAFYEARDFEPVWIVDHEPSRQMKALRLRMAAADEYGLDPALYVTDANAVSMDAASAAADVAFSLAVARFVNHIASGRIAPAEISSIITLEPERPDITAALGKLSRTAGIALALSRFEPPHEQYRALKAELAALRSSGDDAARIVVPEGDLLKPGGIDDRVPLLRDRLGAVLGPDTEPELYDEALVAAVEEFQRQSGLSDDGIVGPRTLIALNGLSREDEIAAVVANLERWRWMPRDLGEFHVFVNVPEFMAYVVDEGAVVHQTRVIVGTPKNRTPTFSHVMNHVVVNPYWNVPASIVRNEMMPMVQRDSSYFARHGYEVFANVGGRVRQINSYWVNWYAVNPRLISVRQVPGDFNALGRIKFMFPNQHSVYLHDTPTKRLFERDMRAFSHGCVRVQNPLDFADSILPHAAPDWNSTRLEEMYGGPERRVDFDNPIPVHISYFTARADAEGEIHFFDDVYGYDAAMAPLLQPQPPGDLAGIMP
jgi:murein L,D-transpeptidase YcbB/YkuD